MRCFAGMRNLDVWYAHAELDELQAQFGAMLDKRQRRVHRKEHGQGAEHGTACRRSTSCAAWWMGSRASSPTRRCSCRSPTWSPGRRTRTGLEDQLDPLISKYRRTLETDRRYLLEQFVFTDIARKVVGVGSVGTRCWIILMLGRDEADPLFLQVKEAERSVLSASRARASTPTRASGSSRAAAHAGDRVTSSSAGSGQKPGSTDRPRDFYVRQLRDWKFSVDIDNMIPNGLRLYGELCGWTLARAHARSGDRIAIASYLGGGDVFDRAIAAFSAAYADQNERDHAALAAAAASGRIKAERDISSSPPRGPTGQAGNRARPPSAASSSPPSCSARPAPK